MRLHNTNENPLPEASCEASLEEKRKGGVVADMKDAADPAVETEPLSEMDFFRQLFFRK